MVDGRKLMNCVGWIIFFRRASRKVAGAKQVSTGKRKSTVGSDAGSVVSASDSRSSTPVLDQRGSRGKKDSLKSDAESDTGRKRKRDHVESVSSSN
jgi:hypothetical protein